MEVKCRFDESKFVVKVYNDCYGGGRPTLHGHALTYFKSLTGNAGERLLQTLEKYGTGGRYTKFGVCLCPIECEDFYTCHEYDGYESPYINKNEYILDENELLDFLINPQVP